jgi:hypothetical protein
MMMMMGMMMMMMMMMTMMVMMMMMMIMTMLMLMLMIVPGLPLQDGQEGDAVHGGVDRGIDSRDVEERRRQVKQQGERVGHLQAPLYQPLGMHSLVCSTQSSAGRAEQLTIRADNHRHGPSRILLRRWPGRISYAALRHDPGYYQSWLALHGHWECVHAAPESSALRDKRLTIRAGINLARKWFAGASPRGRVPPRGPGQGRGPGCRSRRACACPSAAGTPRGDTRAADTNTEPVNHLDCPTHTR